MTYLLLLIFSFNFAHAQTTQTVSIESTYSGRPRFPMYINSKNIAPEVVIFYVYGGGCTFDGDSKNLEMGTIKDRIIKQGFALVVPDYRFQLTFPTDLGRTEKKDAQIDICTKSTTAYLSDLKTAVLATENRFPTAKIFIWGHSFGAYLTNIWATNEFKDSRIHGFISSEGWWVSTEEYSLSFLSPPTLDPISGNSGLLSKMLIIHTEDDSRVPVTQMEFLKKWLSSNPQDKTKIIIYPSGGHYLLADAYPMDRFFKDFAAFIKDYL